MIDYANARLVTLADIYMPNDPRVFFPRRAVRSCAMAQERDGQYPVRKIQVDNLAPVHGDVTPFSQFMEEAIFLTAKPPAAAAGN
jgi:hypothetical protein